MKSSYYYLLILFIFLLLFPDLVYAGESQQRFVGLCSKRLTREVLEESLQLGTQFILHHHKDEGNFSYEYDWLQKRFAPGDSQVRQAGALWGLTLINQFRPSCQLMQAIERGMKFFEKHSRLNQLGARYIIYPGDSHGSTGTVALVALTYIDYLRAGKDILSIEKKTELQTLLDGYLKYLVSARRVDGLWHRSYEHSSGRPYGKPSPYYDGEALLALVKAALYLGRTDLRSAILSSADAGYERNISQALKQDPDSRTTKGYYQWSSMAFFELAKSGWPNTKKYAAYVLDLANWMIDVHQTLKRTRNTGYAYEGIIHAFELARLHKDSSLQKKFACVIERGLEKLTSWQVGNPLANNFIRSHPTEDPKAIGGVQNHRKEPQLRIDVAQHQMHAVILALRYFYEQTHPRRSSVDKEKDLTQCDLENEFEEAGKIWFSDLPPSYNLTPAEEESIVHYAASRIISGTEGHEKQRTFPTISTQNDLTTIVFLSASDGVNSAFVATGTARNIEQSYLNAEKKLLSGVDKKFRAKWLKVDLVDKVFPLERGLSEFLARFDRSTHGFALAGQTGFAFLPEELLRYEWSKLHSANLSELGTARGSPPKELAVIEKNPRVEFAFSTRALFTDGTKVIPLYRGHRMFAELSGEELLAAARAGGDYLVGATRPSGKFIYSYEANSGKESGSYNILRHAGTVYSLLELYEATNDSLILDTASRAISFLLSHVNPSMLVPRTGLCVVERGYTKLGGNALAIVALAKYTELTGDRQYVTVMEKLGEHIRASQMASGEFKHKQEFSSGEFTDFVSKYYPGEALLALVRLYGITKQPMWLDIAQKGANYLIDVRDRGLSVNRIAHDHWLLYALNELYRLRQDVKYLRHAEKIAQAIILSQRTKAEYPDWVGSYYTPPRSTPTAVRTEGLCAAYRLSKSFSFSVNSEEILSAMMRGAAFQLQTQIGPEFALYLADPKRALGGFREGLTSYKIRIDYVQHNISGLLCLAEIQK